MHFVGAVVADLSDIRPPGTVGVGVVPHYKHSFYHFSRFLSEQNTGACMVTPCSGVMTAKACCGGS